jgi:hypothetical protein
MMNPPDGAVHVFDPHLIGPAEADADADADASAKVTTGRFEPGFAGAPPAEPLSEGEPASLRVVVETFELLHEAMTSHAGRRTPIEKNFRSRIAWTLQVSLGRETRSVTQSSGRSLLAANRTLVVRMAVDAH